MGEWAVRAWVGLVILATIARAVPGLLRPTWRDETETMRLATAGAGELTSSLREQDAILAPYYLLARLWLGPFESLPWLRCLSLAAALATLALTAALGRRLLGGFGGCAAVTVLALHPLFMRNAVEARPYALATLAVVACAWLPQRRAAAGSVAVALHLFAALPVAAMLAARRQWRDLAIVAAVTAPLVAAGYIQREQVAWISRAATVGEVVTWLFGASLAVAALALIGSAMSRPWVTVWALGPAVVLFAASHLSPMLAPRYLTFSAPAVALLVSAPWHLADLLRHHVAERRRTAAVSRDVARSPLPCNRKVSETMVPIATEIPSKQLALTAWITPGSRVHLRPDLVLCSPPKGGPADVRTTWPGGATQGHLTAVLPTGRRKRRRC